MSSGTTSAIARNRGRSLTTEQAIGQLRKFCDRVNCDGLRKRDLDQVQKFLQLRVSALPTSATVNTKADIFRRFLHYAESICELEGSALCAIGLGKTAITEMRSANRARLPLELKQARFKCSVLRSLLTEKMRTEQEPRTSITQVEEEGVVRSESESFPEHREAQQWVGTHNSSAKDTRTANGDSPSHNASHGIRFTAIMPHLDGLGPIIGQFLRVGLHTSSMRRKEGTSRFTEAARLYMAPEENMDFRLEIWIGSAAGMAVSQIISAGEDLRDVLGDYLYHVIKLPVQLTQADMDYKLEMILGFDEGSKIYTTVFPII